MKPAYSMKNAAFGRSIQNFELSVHCAALDQCPVLVICQPGWPNLVTKLIYETDLIYIQLYLTYSTRQTCRKWLYTWLYKMRNLRWMRCRTT